MNNNVCSKIRERLLNTHIEKGMPSAEVEQHLDSCKSCMAFSLQINADFEQWEAFADKYQHRNFADIAINSMTSNGNPKQLLTPYYKVAIAAVLSLTLITGGLSVFLTTQLQQNNDDYSNINNTDDSNLLVEFPEKISSDLFFTP